MLFGCLLTQTSIISGGGGGEGESGGGVVELTRDMMARLPKQYDVIEVANKYPVQYYNSMNTVLKQVILYSLQYYLAKILVAFAFDFVCTGGLGSIRILMSLYL